MATDDRAGNRARNRVGRAALVGLCGAAIIAGAVLIAVSIHTLFARFDCATLSAQECALEADLARQHARLQLWSGIAFELLGIALVLWLRGPPKESAKDPTEEPPQEPT